MPLTPQTSTAWRSLPLRAVLFLLAGGIFATSQTLSGYDNVHGRDPVCWLDLGDNLGSEVNGTDTSERNELVQRFVPQKHRSISPACPVGIELVAFAPTDLQAGDRALTGVSYDFFVRGSITLDEGRLFSDNGPRLAVKILLCERGAVGFCTPFVYEKIKGQVDVQSGDAFVSSQTFFVPFDNSSTGKYVFEKVVPVSVDRPGSFFAIVAVQFFIESFDGKNKTELIKHDVANALDLRILSFHDQPEILEVSSGVEVASWVLISLCGVTIAALLFQTMKHLDNQVIKLSQGSFLVVFLVAALFGTISCFLLNPKNDLYCQLAYPMTIIPVHLMYSIMIGRLWRINAVVSPLLRLSLERQDSSTRMSRWFFGFVSKVSNLDCCCNKNKPSGQPKPRNSSMIRTTISSKQLARVVLLFTIPQIIAQTLSLILEPKTLEVEFNDDGSVGRTVCKSAGSTKHALEILGIAILLCLFVELLFVAYSSRKLPSLLNETETIYRVSCVSVGIIILGIVLVAVTNEPTTSPDVGYILSVAIVLTMTLQTSLGVMVPKLRLVWCGEKVLVSKLVTDRRRRRQESFDSAIESSIEVRGRLFYPTSGTDRATNGNLEGTGHTYTGETDHSPVSGPVPPQPATLEEGGDTSVENNTTQAITNNCTQPTLPPPTILRRQESNRRVHFSENDPRSLDDDNTSTASSVEGKERECVGSNHSKEVADQSVGRLSQVSRAALRTAGSLRSLAGSSASSFSSFESRNPFGEPERADERATGVVRKRRTEENGGRNHDHDANNEEQTRPMPGENGERRGSTPSPGFELLRRNRSWRVRRGSAGGATRSGIADGVPGFPDLGRAMSADSGARSPAGGVPDLTALARAASVDNSHIRINLNKSPPRRLVLRMVDLHELLGRINQRIMSGFVVPPEEWILLREASMELGDVFGRDVNFDWERPR